MTYWKRLFYFAVSALGLTVIISTGSAADWPMWGHDSGRRNVTEMELPADMRLLWSREMAAPRRAWPFQYEDYFTSGNPLGRGKLSFDLSYEPIIGGGRLYLPSMAADRVTAYCPETGEELWRYYAGGPVRMAPVYWQEKLYFTSDDGYLYCLDAASGERLWHFRGSYSRRYVLGNERLISIWPARGGPVISDGVLYFAAGVLPFEGIFIHAVCAESGGGLWTNSTSGAIWDLHQHGGAWAYGGPSPQGYLAVSGDKLIVPGGRTPPAVYDRGSGEFLYYRQASGQVGKGAGGFQIRAQGNWFFNHGMLYSLKDGAQYGPVPGAVLTEQSFIGISDGILLAHNAEVTEKDVEVKDRLGRGAVRSQYELEMAWSNRDIGNLEHLFLKAGSYLGVSRDGGGTAALITLDDHGVAHEVAWEYKVDGEIWSMAAAAGKLFVVTREGWIYCFGAGGSDGSPLVHEHSPDALPAVGEDAELAAAIAAQLDRPGGYAYVFGARADLVFNLVRETDLHLIMVHDDRAEAAALRERFDRAGLYGNRVAVIAREEDDPALPPYLAEVAVMTGEGVDREARIKSTFELLRPYGGRLYISDPGADFDPVLTRAELDGGGLEMVGDLAVVTRTGPLPGAGQWTHQYGSAANRTYTDDQLVKPPLGTLWFGGPANLNILPRHYSGPIPQVSHGRLVVLGVDTISARCVYTGRQLWERELPGVGHMFTNLELEERFQEGHEVYMTNHPGANVMGSPYVSVPDGVYVIHNDRLLHLNPVNGETVTEFRLPRLPGVKRNQWGHILVWDDIMVATVDPQFFDEEVSPIHEDAWWNATSSSLLLAMNRFDGEVLWARRADRVGFRHNAITVANGRVFAVDGLSESIVSLLQRRGLEAEMEPVLMALDITTGETIWAIDDNIFGTWLGYYEDRDLLLEGGRHGGKRNLPDEPRRQLVARHGATGEPAWESHQSYSGSLGLHDEMIIPGRPGQRAIDPDSGRTLNFEHPLSREPYEWFYHRYYGCGTMNASRHLIMFRSGAAGYTDLYNFGGSANLGGFRSGCTNNLVAADGVLNAPDYTRSCTCSYQLQTSFAFIHQPEVEMWTLNRLPSVHARIDALGINFGAPGNRRENGVLWLEYPKVYEAGPDLPAEITATAGQLFRHHASWIKNGKDGYGWVGSYGMKGVETISIKVAPDDEDEPGVYDLTFYFAEPEALEVGARVFDVMVQGETKLAGFDVVREAGDHRRLIKVELPGIPATETLDISFSSSEDSLPPIISGVVLVAAGE